MLGWEQKYKGQLLHAFKEHDVLPVCGDKEASKTGLEVYPRVMYSGPMPPPPELICKTCQTWERDHDPMFIAGRAYERQEIARLLGREANRIFRQQEKDYPSNVLDMVSFNLSAGETEELSRRR